MTLGGRMLSVRADIVIRTLTTGDGPLAIYLIDKSIDLAEFTEWKEAAGPVNPEDTTAVERASRGRRIRYLGATVASGVGTLTQLSLRDLSLSGLRFTRVSAGWNYVFYNVGVPMTTGAVAAVSDSIFLRWDKSN